MISDYWHWCTEGGAIGGYILFALPFVVGAIVAVGLLSAVIIAVSSFAEGLRNGLRGDGEEQRPDAG